MGTVANLAVERSFRLAQLQEQARAAPVPRSIPFAETLDCVKRIVGILPPRHDLM